MKNKKGFNEFYNNIKGNNNEIQQIFNKAKEEKKLLNTVQLIICLIVDLLIIVLISNNISFSNYGFIMYFMILAPIIMVDVIICVILYAVLGKNQREYKQKFKEIVINSLISNFYDNVEYFPKKEMPERIYDEAKYNEYYNKYYSDDYIEAKINNLYDIDMAEVHTVHEETHRDSDGDTHTTRTTKFHGLFAKVVMDKSIGNTLKIQRNGKFVFSKEKLEMDSREFEKCFDVSASNNIIGMQILTADIMEMLINFQEKYNMKFDIVIENNIIYLRFHSGTMFEAGAIKKEAFDENTIKKYYDMLEFTYNLSDKLIKIIHEAEI